MMLARIAQCGMSCPVRKSRAADRKTLLRATLAVICAFYWIFCGTVAAGQMSPGTAVDWKAVEAAIGRAGQAQPGDVIKFGMPRKDLHVVLDGVELKPALALGSWIAFKQDGAGAMVMGDLVLTEDEVNPVMKKLLDGGLELPIRCGHDESPGQPPAEAAHPCECEQCRRRVSQLLQGLLPLGAGRLFVRATREEIEIGKEPTLQRFEAPRHRAFPQGTCDWLERLQREARFERDPLPDGLIVPLFVGHAAS